jgi:hypothetical protein
MGILAKLQKTSTARRALLAALASTVLAFSMPSGATSLAEREYEQAVQAFRTGRLSEAFGRFVDLANRGDVDSARVALFMQSYGPVLYGKQWDAGPENVAYWSTLVRNSGTSARPMPEFQPTVLSPGKSKPRTTPLRTRATPEIANVAGN